MGCVWGGVWGVLGVHGTPHALMWDWAGAALWLPGRGQGRSLAGARGGARPGLCIPAGKQPLSCGVLDAASKVTEQEWREKAKKDLEEWNQRQSEQVEKNKINNR